MKDEFDRIMEHLERLRDMKEVWDKEWDILLEGVSDIREKEDKC